ncbi:DMT family transporter [uncultured Ruegeria sp.]|uniref:DMT family transporter n=1 Tax=uncultured Ruegeria sp. TaxID=259304 RepID=UPI002613BC5B|nr:DMT family transporter [uncultured Ruegeria sp.]
MTDNSNLVAVFAALFASAVLSFSDNFVAAVSQEAGLWQFQVTRTLIAVPVIVLLAYLFGVPLRVRSMARLALRSLVISVGLLMYFASLGFLPVAQAGAGLFSSPIWVLVFAVIFLGKRVNIWQVTAMGLGFSGVLMLLQPDLSDASLLLLLPLASGALYGLGALVTKHLCQNENAPTLAVGVFSAMGLISLVLLIYFTAFPPQSDDAPFFARGWEGVSNRFLLLTFCQSLAAVAAVVVIAQAYRVGEPAFVAVCEYSFLVFAAIWTFLLWGETTNDLAVGGIIAILVAGISMFFLSRNVKANPANTSPNT